MMSGDTIISDTVEKIIEITDGAGEPMLIAGAGRFDDISAFAFWIKGGCVAKDKPNLDDDSFVALFVNHEGICFKHEGKHKFGIPIEKGQYIAIGSGRDFALAAMDAGRTAAEAVNIAMGRDPFSGGEVRAAQMTAGRVQRAPKFTSYPRISDQVELKEEQYARIFLDFAEQHEHKSPTLNIDAFLKDETPEERERLKAIYNHAQDIERAREIQKTFESGELNVPSTIQESECPIGSSQGQKANDQEVRCDTDTGSEAVGSVESGELPTAGSILRPLTLEQKSLQFWNQRRLDAIQALYPLTSEQVQPDDNQGADRSDPAV